MSCSVQASELDCPPGQQGNQATGQGGSFLDTGRRPFLRGMLKSKSKTQLVKAALPEAQAGRCPVWRLICLVRGSGCFIHDARCHLGGMVTPHPGTPFPRDLESTPHPLMAPGDHQVVEIPRMDSRVKYLHSIDFPFICEKSICFSWFSVFAF